MKSALRATALLSSRSVATILVGLVSSKVWAVLVGPSGVGLYGLMLSLLALGTMVLGLGVQTGVVRLGASALGTGDRGRMEAVRRSAGELALVSGAAAVLLFAALSRPIAAGLLGGAEHAAAAVLVGVAVCLTLLSNIQTGILNAHHRVSALARSGVVTSVGGSAVGIVLIFGWGERAIPWAVVGAAAVSLAATSWLVSRELGPAASGPAREERSAARAGLLRFGVPFTASALVGAGVLQLIPVLVAQEFGAVGVGFYRAASSISVGYLGFLLTAMAQDYYPRVSALSHRPAELADAVNEQLRLLTLIGAPILIGAQVATPYLVPLVYSREFAPTSGILQWQLLGSLFKFWSWAFAFAILARASATRYGVVEAVAGAGLLLWTWLGVRALGLPGLGVGFFLAYAVYFGVTWIVVRRDIGFRLAPSNLVLMAVALCSAALIQALSIFAPVGVRIPVSVCIVGIVGGRCAYLLFRELRGTRRPDGARHDFFPSAPRGGLLWRGARRSRQETG